MLILAAVDAIHYLFSIPLTLICVFLILLILVQRGRGGGLTGALGGMGGQSAFGTKAGDVFTRITIGAAIIWILLSMVSLKVLSGRATTGPLDANQRTTTTPAAPADGKGAAPAGKTPASSGPATTAPPATTTPAPSTPAATPAGDSSK